MAGGIFVDFIKIKNLEIGRLSWWIQPNSTMRSLTVGNEIDGSRKRIDLLLVALEEEDDAVSQGM